MNSLRSEKGNCFSELSICEGNVQLEVGANVTNTGSGFEIFWEEKNYCFSTFQISLLLPFDKSNFWLRHFERLPRISFNDCYSQILFQNWMKKIIIAGIILSATKHRRRDFLFCYSMYSSQPTGDLQSLYTAFYTGE